jgi:hypothetical protein
MYYEHISKMLLRIGKEKINKKDDRVKNNRFKSIGYTL